MNRRIYIPPADFRWLQAEAARVSGPVPTTPTALFWAIWERGLNAYKAEGRA